MGYITTSPNCKLYYEIHPTTSTSRCPYLLVLHPTTFDISLIAEGLSDPDILSRFNVVCFDQRHHGRTVNKADPRSDCWALAADLALAMDALKLPPVHVLAGQSWQSEVAIRLALLFPERVLSLLLYGVGPELEDPDFKAALKETTEGWVNAETPEEWDEAVSSLQHSQYGADLPYVTEQSDRWAAAMIRRYPPSNSLDMVCLAWVYINRTSIPLDWTSALEVPILLMHGTADTVYTVKDGTERMKRFPKALGGASINVVPNGTSVPSNWNVIKTKFIPFVERLIAKSAPQSLEPCTSNFQEALQTLANRMGNPKIAFRQPTHSISYSTKGEEEIGAADVLFRTIEENQKIKFGLLGGGSMESWAGAPLEEEVPWRFSERFNEVRFNEAHFRRGSVIDSSPVTFDEAGCGGQDCFCDFATATTTVETVEVLAHINGHTEKSGSVKEYWAESENHVQVP